MEIKPLTLIDSKGNTQQVEMRLFDEDEDNADAVAIELSLAGRVLRADSERGFFFAFAGIRRQLEQLDLHAHCFASCENVFPSPMIESMGDGRKAYRLTLGKQAKMTDLVEIFETADDVRPVPFEKQQDFYNRWLNSCNDKQS